LKAPLSPDIGAFALLRPDSFRAKRAKFVEPASEAGIADHVWSLEEIAALVPKPVAKKRGPYKKRPPEISN